MIEACTCGFKHFEESGFGMDFCLQCGVGRRSQADMIETRYTTSTPLSGHQSYTRVKRFKKYLCRAMRQQSSCTVPRDTWDYLLEHRPYRNAKHIQHTLKKARHLKRKCYDSLPFLTSLLCPNVNVPNIEEHEKTQALYHFSKIDRAIKTGPFVSYLFCLEYILTKIGRADMCDYINKIQCPKRRSAYKVKLDQIFGRKESDRIRCLFRTHA